MQIKPKHMKHNRCESFPCELCLTTGIAGLELASQHSVHHSTNTTVGTIQQNIRTLSQF